MMAWLPMLSVLVESEAALVVAPLDASCWVPRAVDPSMNVTAPVGDPELTDGLVMLAVKVTDWPMLAGFSEDVTFAVGAVGLTTWLSTVEVAAPKFGVAA